MASGRSILDQKLVNLRRFNFEEERFKSFKYWPPDAPVDKTPIARAGFFYTGNGLEVTCYSCLKNVSNWKYGDKAMEKHKYISPRCSFVKDPLDSDNVPQNEMKFYKKIGPNTYNSCNFSAHRIKRNRVDSFKLLRFIPVKQRSVLANCGFFYSSKRKMIICAFCGVSITLWEANENANYYHRLKMNDCPFLLRNLVNLNAIDVKPGIVTLRSKALDFDPRFELNVKTLNNLGVLNLKFPAYTNYMLEEDRLATFKMWPKYDDVKSEDLAEAGFFYQGTSDSVCCYYCKGTLKDWTLGDNAWLEHAKWFPKCEYVLLSRGKEFVDKAARLLLEKSSPTVTPDCLNYGNQSSDDESPVHDMIYPEPGIEDEYTQLQFGHEENMHIAGNVYLFQTSQRSSGGTEEAANLDLSNGWNIVDILRSRDGEDITIQMESSEECHEPRFGTRSLVIFGPSDTPTSEQLHGIQQYDMLSAVRTLTDNRKLLPKRMFYRRCNSNDELRRDPIGNELLSDRGAISLSGLNDITHSFDAVPRSSSYWSSLQQGRTYGNSSSGSDAEQDVDERIRGDPHFEFFERDRPVHRSDSDSITVSEMVTTSSLPSTRWILCSFRDLLELMSEDEHSAGMSQNNDREPDIRNESTMLNQNGDSLYNRDVAIHVSGMESRTDENGNVNLFSSTYLNLDQGATLHENSEEIRSENEITCIGQNSNAGNIEPTATESTIQPIGIKPTAQPTAIEPAVSTAEKKLLEVMLENRRLKDDRLCKVCMDRDVCIVFLTCGHLVTCGVCAVSMMYCPLCRNEIVGQVRIYLS